MAAGQQKKRLNVSSAVSGNLQQYSAKRKKNAESSQALSNMRSRVSVELDEKDIMIVSKREQVGIGWSDLGPFIDSFSKCGLADVVTIPEETLDLEDMTDVLSYEVYIVILCLSFYIFILIFIVDGSLIVSYLFIYNLRALRRICFRCGKHIFQTWREIFFSSFFLKE